MRTAGDVLLYVPQWIGYSRVALFVLALVEANILRNIEADYVNLLPTGIGGGRVYLPSGWLESRAGQSAMRAVVKFVVFYLGSFVGDLFDGWAARKCDQCSKFGGILDMVTDRLATCGVLALLCAMDPKWALYYVFFLLLDVASHWVHTIAAKGHHKEESKVACDNADGKGGRGDEGIFVHMCRTSINAYYGVYVLFGYCCVSAELMWMALVVTRVLAASRHPASPYVIMLIRLVRPGMMLKNFINVLQLLLACYDIAQADADEYNNANANAISDVASGAVAASTKPKAKTKAKARAVKKAVPTSPYTSPSPSPPLSPAGPTRRRLSVGRE